MKKMFTDIFVELADEADKGDAARIAKVLEKNGIDSITRLINMDWENISSIKGIGPRALHVISVIKTREQCKAEKMMNLYKKTKGKDLPRDIKYYMEKLGNTHLSACQFERVLKRGGINTFEDFLETPLEEIGQIKGIGPKRLKQCEELKSMIKPVPKRSSHRKHSYAH